MNYELGESINSAKRNCNRCYVQKTFKQNDEDKKLAQKACKRTIDLFREEFDLKRRSEETTNKQIEDLKIAKGICLDALEACENCNKNAPRMKNILLELKN